MSLLSVYNDIKKVYGICPCCGEIFRLSDATLFSKTPPPKTQFDVLKDSQARLERSVERFGEQEDQIREDARSRGMKLAQRRLRRIAPAFLSRQINPNDVKVIFDPVEYIAFRGLNAGSCTGIELIDRPPGDRRKERIHSSIESAVKRGNLEWRTIQITDDGEVAKEP